MLTISLAYTPFPANEVAASRFSSTYHAYPKLNEAPGRDAYRLIHLLRGVDYALEERVGGGEVILRAFGARSI